VFHLTRCLHTAIFADTIEAPYLRITSGHYANIGEKDTLFKDREPPKTIPYSAARAYIAHIGEYPPRGGRARLMLEISYALRLGRALIRARVVRREEFATIF